MTFCTQNCVRKLKCLRAVLQRRIDAFFFFVIFPPVLLIEVIIVYLFLLWWGGTILRTILLMHAAWAMYDPTPRRGMQLEVGSTSSAYFSVSVFIFPFLNAFTNCIHKGGWGPWFGASFFKNLRLWNFVTKYAVTA